MGFKTIIGGQGTAGHKNSYDGERIVLSVRPKMIKGEPSGVSTFALNISNDLCKKYKMVGAKVVLAEGDGDDEGKLGLLWSLTGNAIYRNKSTANYARCVFTVSDGHGIKEGIYDCAFESIDDGKKFAGLILTLRQ